MYVVGVVLLVIGIIVMLVCLYMLVRNEWVFRKRMHMISSQDVYKGYVPIERFMESYHSMMAKFWKWDLDSFITDRACYNKALANMREGRRGD